MSHQRSQIRGHRIKPSRRVCRRTRLYHRRLFVEGLEERQLLAAFTPGNLVAYRVGFRPDESPPPGFTLTGAAVPVFLD